MRNTCKVIQPGGIMGNSSPLSEKSLSLLIGEVDWLIFSVAREAAANYAEHILGQTAGTHYVRRDKDGKSDLWQCLSLPRFRQRLPRFRQSRCVTVPYREQVVIDSRPRPS